MIPTFDSYQDLTRRTAADYDDPQLAAAVFALGLAGEAGETADLIKKSVGHGHDLDLGKLASELGDVLWYLAVLADHHGLWLSDIAAANLDKLQRRYPEGFSTAASIARVDAA